MNLLEDLLNRHERDPRSHGQRQRDRALSREESAALASASSAQRKVAFDRWVRSQIAKKLAAALPEAPAQRAARSDSRTSSNSPTPMHADFANNQLAS
jgi:hypothetical protein